MFAMERRLLGGDGEVVEGLGNCVATYSKNDQDAEQEFYSHSDD